MKRTVTIAGLVAVAFVAGRARSQDSDLEAKLAEVRREVKHVDLDEGIRRLPGIVERERAYAELIGKVKAAEAAGEDVEPLLKQGRELKLAALEELNAILDLHRGKHVGLSEEQVYERLRDARFSDVHYRDEWLVNILDDLEEMAQINIEMDARVYKFDTVSFDFEKTSARAMLQMMADTLLFDWVVRGDTLYVYKERHETLFGGEWIRAKKAAWKARQDAIEEARKKAEAEALGEEAD